MRNTFPFLIIFSPFYFVGLASGPGRPGCSLRACAGLKRAETALEVVALAPSRGVPMVKDRYAAAGGEHIWVFLFVHAAGGHACVHISSQCYT